VSFSIHGQAVSRGIVVGRAVLVSAGRMDVAHYFIEPEQITSELLRMLKARDLVVQEIEQVQRRLTELPATDAPTELTALLDVHLMLLQDDTIAHGVREWIKERRYNAEWALTAQLEVISRQFDEMEDPYLRERKADLEQVVQRMLAAMSGESASLLEQAKQAAVLPNGSAAAAERVPLILVARDLSPSDLLQFKDSVFDGFVTEVGGKTSHTAIVARGLDIAAVVGARGASQLIKQDDWVVIDGNAGVVVVDPSPIILEEYGFKQREGTLERERLSRLRHTPSVTLDGQRVELLANIELPQDTAAAVSAGAVGVGLFRTEFLFMGRVAKGLSKLPDEEEQYAAYVCAIEGMQGMPVTIRTIDIGADKPLERSTRSGDEHLNPALGLRAIRWSLAEPAMFLVQLRAILRAAAHGQVDLLIPMLAHVSEIKQTLALIERAKEQLASQGVAYGSVRLGAMIEVPAAAMMAQVFLRYFDFLSIGTNDLIQYTLAVDRVDEAVNHLYDPLHPAVLGLMAQVIAACHAQGKDVSVCGEMAGDTQFTGLLLGIGLRSFSMQPTQILAVKQQVLRANTATLAPWAQDVLASEQPSELLSIR
jgi:phosphoenolpyruvate-protein phosphotransferase (PTS system enzyme I)